MKKLARIIVLSVLLGVFFLSPYTACAKSLVVGLHYAPPWSYKNEQGQIVGIDKEIIETIFKSRGYEVTFEISGYSRMLKSFSDHKVDFASPIAVPIPGAIMTEKHLPFRDVAISLIEKKLVIQKIADLKGKTVVAYQEANKVLGGEFRSLVSSQPNYTELAERENQLQMLFKGRADVVVGENRILTFLSQQLYGENRISIHTIFPVINYGGAGWNEQVVKDFNMGLQELKQKGIYQQILDKPRR
jgi:polar amino acid transport system substrate-binding protein